jgi:DNA-binding CsgD family transcriptional regulator
MAGAVEHPSGRRLRPFGLAGRTWELALAQEQLEVALGGAGRLLLIAGEAGIGKTTIASALARAAADRSALVLTGACYDLTETPPYGPWLEIARGYPAVSADLPIVPALPEVLAQQGGATTAGGRDALFADVLAFFAAVTARTPLVVILEDLHWCDPASLELLRRLAREASRLPLLLVATYRSEELDRQQPLYTLLPLLVREAQATRLELRPLDDGGVRELISGRYTLAPADRERLLLHLQARAEGNPFFLEELLRALEDERILRPPRQSDADLTWVLADITTLGLPMLLRQVLDRRLSRLTEDERGLLAVAATIGQEVSLELWAVVGLVDDETLLGVIERGVAARLLQMPDNGTVIRFSHALVREALYEGLLPPRRRVWHRRVAEALTALPASDPDAVAYHFRRAGDARAKAWLVRAGERAQRSYAWLTAAERFEAALALPADDADPAEEARLLVTVAQLRRYTEPAQGVARLEEAERLAAAAGEPALAAAARFDRGHLLCMARDFQRGLPEMQAGLAALEALPEDERAALPTLAVLEIAPEERLRYHRGVLSLFLAVLGHLADARNVVGVDDSAGTVTAREHLGRGWLYAALGEPDRGRRALAGARGAYGDQHWEAATTLFLELDLVVLPYQTEQLDERRRLAEDAARAWRRAGGAHSDFPPRFAQLPLLLLEGRWTEAREVALATFAAVQSNDAWRRYPGRFLAQIAGAQGEIETARQLVHDELPAGPETVPGATWFLPALVLQRIAAALALDDGDLATAHAWLAAHDRWLAWSGARLGRSEGRLGWAAYHRAAGNMPLARQHAQEALSLAGTPRQPLALLAAQRLLGELATAAGDVLAAATWLDAALALADACAAPFERALCLLALAELRRATRDRQGIEPLVDEARRICEPLGARSAIARAAALLPARVPTPSGGYPDGLSPREAEVLGLIATGISNQEIADALVLSVRTVERHINSLYRKIDARGRADATAYAARHGLLSSPLTGAVPTPD